MNQIKVKLLRRLKPNPIRVKNKIYALIVILIGFMATLPDNDPTFLIFASIIGVDLFFSREKIMT